MSLLSMLTADGQIFDNFWETNPMTWARLMFVFGSLTISAMGQDGSTSIEIRPSVPGNYSVLSGNHQQVMRSYRIDNSTLPPSDRSTIEKGFNDLLVHDGQGGGTAQVVAQVLPDGSDSTLLIVVATPAMQESIVKVVEELNNSKFADYFGGLPSYVVYKPKYRSAEAIAEAIKAELTGQIGNIHVDSVANLVTIEDEPFVAKWLLEEVLPAFDIPPPQVQVLVQIVEVENGSGSQVGMNWNAFRDSLPSNIDFDLGATRLPTGDRKGKMRFDSFNTLVSGISPQALGAFFEFMESKGKAKILSQATINIVNGEPSKIEAGVRLPFTALVENEGGNKKFRDDNILDGVTVEITGVVAEIGRRFNISATVNSVVGWSVGNLPMTSTSTVTSTVNLKDGNSIVISGLKRLRKVETTHHGSLDLFQIFPKKIKEDREWDVLIIVHALKSTQEVSEVGSRLPSEAKGF